MIEDESDESRLSNKSFFRQHSRTFRKKNKILITVTNIEVRPCKDSLNLPHLQRMATY